MFITVAETNISDLGLSQSSEVRTSKPTKSIHPSYHVLHVVGKLLAFRPPKWLSWNSQMTIARQPLGHVLPLHVPSDLSPAQPAAGAQASQGPWSFESLSSADSNEEKGCELKE